LLILNTAKMTIKRSPMLNKNRELCENAKIVFKKDQQ